MDPNSEAEYALSSGPLKRPKLGEMSGSNREGGLGASQDTVGKGSEAKASGGKKGYNFFGDADGHNKDTFHEPAVKKPSTPTLNAPVFGRADY